MSQLHRAMFIARKFPCSTYAALAAGVYVLMRIGHVDLQYDDGGLGTLVFFGFPVWGFPFWLAQEWLFSLNGGRSFVGMTPIMLIGGIVLCALVDLTVIRLWRRKAGRPGFGVVTTVPPVSGRGKDEGAHRRATELAGKLL